MPSTKQKEEKEESLKKEEESDEEEEEEEKEICCVICSASVDYSDKSYFCQKARDEDSDLEGVQPALLPLSLYNPQNALVFCDTCDRPFHQHCHFVPLFSLPHKDWHCLICTSKKAPPTEDNDDNFYTMQNATPAALQSHFERKTRLDKLALYKTEFRRLWNQMKQQMQQIRLAQTTILSYTNTKRARKNFTIRSQELCQTFLRYTTAKRKCRDSLLNMRRVLQHPNQEDVMATLLKFVKENPKEKEHWFPFGIRENRQIPRFGAEEDKPAAAANGEDEVPKQVLVSKEPEMTKKVAPPTAKCVNVPKTNPKSDDDSGISLDDLKCCICFVGDASDENDLLMCDGRGCFRSHHMQCLQPALSEPPEEDDWFCPLCQAFAKILAGVQSEYTGDEWNADGESIVSWEHAEDVFPEVMLEHKYAQQWKSGNMDEECHDFLQHMFGETKVQEAAAAQEQYVEMEEDDDEDDDFDLTDFQKERNQTYEENANDDSDHSSQATLQDMSSVEIKIRKSELAALSSGESDSDSSDDDDDNENDDEAGRRKSRRLRSAPQTSRSGTDTEGGSTDGQPDVVVDWRDKDMGKLDESNILKGRRRRKKVDYQRLNDSMFGQVVDPDKLDDQEEFQFKYVRRNSNSSSSNSGEGDDEDSTGGEDEGSTSGEHDSEGDDSQKEKGGDEKVEPKKKSTKKNARPSQTKRKRASDNHTGGSKGEKEAAATNSKRKKSNGAGVNDNDDVPRRRVTNVAGKRKKSS